MCLANSFNLILLYNDLKKDLTQQIVSTQLVDNQFILLEKNFVSYFLHLDLTITFVDLS